MTTKTITITDPTEHKHGNLYLCEGELFLLTRVEGFTTLITLISLLNGLPYNYCSTKVSNDITRSDWVFLTDECPDSFKLVKTVDFNVAI